MNEAVAPMIQAAVPAVNAAAAPGIGLALQFLSPMLEVGTSLASPVVEGISAVTQSAQAGAGGPDPNAATNGSIPRDKAAGTKAGGGAGPGGAVKGVGAQSVPADSPLRPQSPSAPVLGEDG